ncbi:MAG: hypothetical protein LAN62_17435 [Acidobacteriia bacterium]|nr:hypothetical protein [Terriglobia bacterium]
MADSAREMELIRLATRHVEQIPEIVAAVEARLKSDPGDARDFHRLCAVLTQKLLTAEGSVEELLQKLHTAETVGTGRR